MKRLMVTLTALGMASLFGARASAESSPTFGRYVGVLRHPALKQEQLAKLDFIPSREENNVIQLKAVLTLHFGDFKSGEYVAYHFDDVRFNILTKTFVFDQADQPVTLVVKHFSENEFSGDFRSSYSGEIGKIVLRKDGVVKPTMPLIEPIWGEYKGACVSRTTGKKADTVVQLYTYRSSEGAIQVGDPFRAYKIRGFVAEGKGGSCPAGSPCVWGNVQSASYNFFKGRLIVFNNYSNLNCEVRSDGLACRGCDFLKRASDETSGDRAFLPPTATAKALTVATTTEVALKDDVASIQGEYHGYLHHEYLDRYQEGSLNILTYQAQTATGAPATLRMSAVASLHFGKESDAETLSYRFNERSYPNPLLAPQFVFSQTTADVDAVLQITSLGKGVVKGIWFSQIFGRVGSFEFRKEKMTLPSGTQVIEPIGAHYESNDWELDLMVGMGVAAPNTENPFAPLTLGGWVISYPITPKIHITGGSYDFYTGRIAFETGEKMAHVGQRNSRKRFYLKKLGMGIMSPLPPHALVPYRITGESEN